MLIILQPELDERYVSGRRHARQKGFRLQATGIREKVHAETIRRKRYHQQQQRFHGAGRRKAVSQDLKPEAHKRRRVVDHRPSGVAMSYRDLGEGAGDPLVLLHAFPLNGRMFGPQMKAFSGERRIVAPDYPGFGRSPRTPAQPDVRYYAEGVLGLLDRLHFERVILGGVSLGGYVAFECMRLFPGRVSAFVLANTRPEPDPEEMREIRNEMALSVARDGVEVLVDL